MDTPEEFEGREVQMKVLGVTDVGGLFPCSGGHTSFRYAPPKKVDGVWVPGDWTPEISSVVCCSRGYHVTRDPSAWINNYRGRIFWAECAGVGARSPDALQIAADKTAFSSIRLLRPVQLKDLKPQDKESSDIEVIFNLVPVTVFMRVLAKIQLDWFIKNSVVTPYYDEIVRLLRAYVMGTATAADEEQAKKMVNWDERTLPYISRYLNCVPNAFFSHDSRMVQRALGDVMGGNFGIFSEKRAGQLFQELVSVELRNDYGDEWMYNKPIIFDEKHGKFYPATRRQIRDAREAKALYEDYKLAVKVVAETATGELVPCSGGSIDFRYSAPRPGANGVCHPGDWTSAVSPAVCHRGYHVTHEPQTWSAIQHETMLAYEGCKLRMFLAQTRGARAGSGSNKVAFESIRLLRPLRIRDMDMLDAGAVNERAVLSEITHNGKLEAAVYAVAALNELKDTDPSSMLKGLRSFARGTFAPEDRHRRVFELLKKLAKTGELSEVEATEASLISTDYEEYTLYDVPNFANRCSTAYVLRSLTGNVSDLFKTVLHKSFFKNTEQPWRLVRVNGNYRIYPARKNK